MRRPIAVKDDLAGGQVDQGITVRVLDNDSSPDSAIDPSTLTVTVAPVHGTVTGLDRAAGTISYLPHTGYSGSDQLTYRVCDRDGFCGTAAVHLATPPIDISIRFVPVGDVRNHDTVRYDVYVTNNGPRVSDGALDMNVSLSPYLSSPQASGPNWQFAGTRVGGARLVAAAATAAPAATANGPTVAGTYPRSLGVNETSVVRITARLDAPGGAKIVNGVDVRGAFAETNMENNAAAFTVSLDDPTVAAPAAAAAAVAAPPVATPEAAPSTKDAVLARTGAAVTAPAGVGTGLLSIGLLLLLVGRRRRRRDEIQPQ